MPAVATVRAGNIIGGGDWAEGRLVPECLRAAMLGHAPVLRRPKLFGRGSMCWSRSPGTSSWRSHVYARRILRRSMEFGPRERDMRTVAGVAEALCAPLAVLRRCKFHWFNRSSQSTDSVMKQLCRSLTVLRHSTVLAGGRGGMSPKRSLIRLTGMSSG